MSECLQHLFGRKQAQQLQHRGRARVITVDNRLFISWAEEGENGEKDNSRVIYRAELKETFFTVHPFIRIMHEEGNVIIFLSKTAGDQFMDWDIRSWLEGKQRNERAKKSRFEGSFIIVILT